MASKVLYVIGGLGRGGAEKQLYLLLKHLDRQAFAPAVVSLSIGGAWADPVRDLGVTLIELPRRRGRELGRLVAIYRIIRQIAPAILQTFLFSDNAYGLLAGRLARVQILIASRRIDQYGETRRLLRRLNQALGHWADAIICNAERSRQYAPPALAPRHVVIHNGTEPLIPKRSSAEVRQSLGLPVEGLVVGNIGRLVPAKNHRLFVEVAAEILRARADTVFLLVGSGPLETELRDRVRQLGLEGRVILTGERADVADLLGAMDLFLLTSDREGMSNAIMEAMIAGLPCVVTDAGGNEELVIHGESGYICPRADRTALVEHARRLLDDPELRWRFGANGRRRMERWFSAERMARATEALYTTLLSARGEAVPSLAFACSAEGGGEARK